MNEPPEKDHFAAARDFRVAQIGGGATAHYVDDYRYQPGRTVCGRWLSESDEIRTELELPLCRVCSRRDGYPTEVEFREYHMCTDCGADTWPLGGYTVRNKLWNIAYPLYRKGVGVGSSRPCIGCLEKRLGRALTVDDFILLPGGICPDNSSRLTDVRGEPPAAGDKVKIGAKIWRCIFRGRSRTQPRMSWKKVGPRIPSDAQDSRASNSASTPPSTNSKKAQ